MTDKLRALFLILALALLLTGLAACSENAQTDKTPDATATAERPRRRRSAGIRLGQVQPRETRSTA